MKPTKEQVLACEDKQQLIDWAAVICMGYKEKEMVFDWGFDIAYQSLDMRLFDKKDWQPCSNTDKGIAQAIGLAVKYKLELDFDSNVVSYSVHNANYMKSIDFTFSSWQVAVAKAALISELGE